MKANLAVSEERKEIEEGLSLAIEALNQIAANYDDFRTVDMKNAFATLARNQKMILKRLAQIR